MKLRTSIIERTNIRGHTLLYALLMLALHPFVQDALYSEIQETIGSRIPTYDDFPNLVYPLCIMFETLRLFPPVIAIPKVAVKSDHMLLGKYLIPRGSTIIYTVAHLHRNPNYWGDDVESFKPSRFYGRMVTEKTVDENTGDTSPGASNEKIKMPIKGAFVPFSEGARSCLGKPCVIGLIF